MITIEMNKHTKWVLTNDQDKVVAIIDCPEGTTDITEKISLAIKEDMVADEVSITTVQHINNYDSHCEFDAEVKDEDYEITEYSFELLLTAEY